MTQSLSWLRQIVESSQTTALIEHLNEAGRVIAEGARGSSAALLAGTLALKLDRPVLYVVAHLDEADDALDDLELFQQLSGGQGKGLTFERFGALEVLPGESNVSLDLLAERLRMVGAVSSGDTPSLVVAPIQALMQAVPQPEALSDYVMSLRVDMTLEPNDLIHWLDAANYTRQDAIEQVGDFAMRGGIIDIFTANHGPVRLDFFGDELETIASIDTDTMGSGSKLKGIDLIGASSEKLQSDERTANLIDLLPSDTVTILQEAMELGEQARGYYERLTSPKGIFAPSTVFKKLTERPNVELNNYSQRPDEKHRVELPVTPLPAFPHDARDAISDLAKMLEDDNETIHVLCQKDAEANRLRELFEELHPESLDKINIETSYLHRGFVWNSDDNGAFSSCLLLPHHELFHRYETRRRIRRITTGAASVATGGKSSDAFLDLNVGDYVVHVDHGIARFAGLKTLRRQNQSQEFLHLEFADSATLHVPAVQIDLIQKYVGGFEGRPPLSVLGGKRWKKTKEDVADAVKEMAKKLLQVQAAREIQPGIRFPSDTAWQKEFEAEFPYAETEDQLAAIAAVKSDMARERPMDRLVCGDVGFGKTEVAIRAAFKAVEYGKQVAVLVPTTVLAEQHGKTFRNRMADYPFRVESLSRFKTNAEAKEILKEVAQGKVDIVIGTHRLLSKDVKFPDLGLVIVDEEQRFGVEHKNKLLEMRLTADVMTLTATPIPRTLHMSMVGLRDISSLSTPPVDRRAVVTEVISYDEGRIKQAILRELNRDGQIFFVHNRVHNIQSVADDLRRLVPDAKIIIGHGQMPTKELEKVMLQFTRRQADILVSTTIIESGIDIPTANTMFINQADMFGLAELHQLRGRVGRYKHRAYCYLLLPNDRPINDVAARRLKAIEQYAMLGAGFKIAMRDLEIRGAGNLLGSEQSGHIAAVGYEMYCVLLEQETKRLKNEPLITPARTHLELPITGSLPKRYIASDKFRMEAYRRLSRAVSLHELEQVIQHITDAYGEPPAIAQQLIDLTELRIAASTINIDRIKLEGDDLIFTYKGTGQRPQASSNRHRVHLPDLLDAAPGRSTVIDETTIYWRPPKNYLSQMDTLLAVLRKLLVRPVREMMDAPEPQPV